MANELQSLSKIFQNRIFRIPDYQRGYAWQKPQLVDFWDDLVNLQEGKNHYTGLLSLKPLTSEETQQWGEDLWMIEKGYEPCHVIDGQQRLTTFVILVNEIIEFIKQTAEYKADPSSVVMGFDTISGITEKYICQKRPPHNRITTYLFSYENDNPSAEFLRYKVFNESYSGTISETYYTKNLKFAKQFFADNLTALYNDEKNGGIAGIEAIYKKLTLHFMFNIHEIDDDYDVFVAFETMNNRGKKLTNLELLKNRLIYLTTLYSNAEFDEIEKKHLRDEINDSWKEVYYQLGRNVRLPLSDDEYLRAHWIIYFKYSRQKGDDYIQFLLSKFSAKNIYEKETVVPDSDDDEVVLRDEDADIDTVEGVEERDALSCSQLKPDEIGDYVRSLKSLAKYWYYSWFPYESTELTNEEKRGIDRLNRIGIGYFRPLVVAIISDEAATDAEKAAALAAMERFVFVDFRVGGFMSSYKSSDYYRAAHAVYTKEQTIPETTLDIKGSVDADTQYAIQNFTNKVGKWFEEGNGYYDWGSLRYFMYEYEYSLMEQSGTEKITWEMFTKSEKDKVSIEHVLPQTPTKFYWRNMFRQYSNLEIKQMSGSIGNLLPLSLNINIKLQNDSFQDKKQAKPGRRGYEDGSHSEIEVARNADWTAKCIYDRCVKLIDFMATRWNIVLTEEQKDKLIFVGFAKDARPDVPELTEEASAPVADDGQPLAEDRKTIFDVITKWCEDMQAAGSVEFDAKNSATTLIRFTTARMNGIIPRATQATSGWGTRDYYFYEINNKKDGFRMQLAISGKDVPENVQSAFDTVIPAMKAKGKKQGWEWKTLYATSWATYSDANTEALIRHTLDEQLQEIRAMENNLINHISEKAKGQPEEQ